MPFALVAILTGVMLLWPTAAAASCAGPSRQLVAQSPIAFVGTVTAVDGGYARLDVDTVARGPDLAPSVWVQTGQQPSLFNVGSRYAVGGYDDFRTNECLVYETNTTTVAGVAPGQHRQPGANGLTGADVATSGPPGLLVAGVIVGAVTALVLGVRRRSRRPPGRVAVGT